MLLHLSNPEVRAAGIVLAGLHWLTSGTFYNVSSDLRESEQVILSAHTRCRHTTYELALLSIIL